MPFQPEFGSFTSSLRPTTILPPDLDLIKRQQAQNLVGYTFSNSDCLSQGPCGIVLDIVNCISQGYPSLVLQERPLWKLSCLDQLFPDMLVVALDLVLFQPFVSLTRSTIPIAFFNLVSPPVKSMYLLLLY
jgi:hypothetical protein